jgi:hypothetical protein
LYIKLPYDHGHDGPAPFYNRWQTTIVQQMTDDNRQWYLILL